MTQPHSSSALQVLNHVPRCLHFTGVIALQTRRGGWLRVSRGEVWITRPGDLHDHVLAAGEAFYLRAGEQLLAEPWHAGQSVDLAWAVGAPAPVQAADGLRRTAAALVLTALARGLRAAAGRLAAAARRAEAMAMRAQGSIRPGDSMASSGALQ